MNNETRRTAADRAVLLLSLALFAVVLVRTAWLCDDAYITLRVVDNFVNGHGLVWNAGERVQVYTHPFWLFVLALPYALTREGYLTPLAISMAVSLFAAAVLASRVARTTLPGVVAVAALVFSQAYVDYSTSGLENPLTHLVLAVFLALYFRDIQGAGTLFLLAVLASLAAANRLDTFLLLLPPLVYAWLSVHSVRGTLALLAGLLPLAAWELFAIAYYGFPFPNTAYAKLGTGIAPQDLIEQGLYYLDNCRHRDPLTILAMIAGILISVLRWNGRALAVSLGMFLYLAYVVRVGGDFMAGRFLTAPFLCGVALCVGWPQSERERVARRCRAFFEWPGRHVGGLAAISALLGILAVGFGGVGPLERVGGAVVRLAGHIDADPAWANPEPTVLTTSAYGRIPAGFKDARGIGNERMFYFPEAGLLRYHRNAALPGGRYAREGQEYRRQAKAITEVHGSVGFRGYFAGPDAFIVDYFALTDPLLARLPALYTPNWRIGHFTRKVPAGYEQTVAAFQAKPPEFESSGNVLAGAPWEWPLWTELRRMLSGHYNEPREGELLAVHLENNKIEDIKLAAYYDQLALITRGPLGSRERWVAIWRMNTGYYDSLIDEDAYRYSEMRRVVLADVDAPAQHGISWGGEPGIAIGMRGLHVALDTVRHETTIEIALDANDVYRVLLMNGKRVVAEQDLGPGQDSGRALAVYDLDVSGNIAAAGYDGIRVFPFRGDSRYRVGYIAIGGVAETAAAESAPAGV